MWLVPTNRLTAFFLALVIPMLAMTVFVFLVKGIADARYTTPETSGCSRVNVIIEDSEADFFKLRRRAENNAKSAVEEFSQSRDAKLRELAAKVSPDDEGSTLKTKFQRISERCKELGLETRG